LTHRHSWRFCCWFAALAFIVCGSIAGPAHSDLAAPVFKRGATLVEFFQFPATTGDGAAKTYADPAYPNAQSALNLFDFDDLRRMGFDHMRVPLDVGPLMTGDEDERAAIINQLLNVVAEINSHGLSVVVPLFPPSLQHELPETYLDGLDGPKFTAYLAQVERVAAALQTVHSGVVAMEAMNEPQDKCRTLFGTDWTTYQEFMVARIRRVAAQLPLFLTGGCWSDIQGIVELDSDLVRDPRNYISVHFYRPFLFTHQGSWWTTSFAKGTTGVPYPASAGSAAETLALTRARFSTFAAAPDFDPFAAERKAESEIGKYFADGEGPVQIDGWMKQLADWQQRERVDPSHIIFTEFGAIKQTIDGSEFDRASRERWLRDTSSAIENHGWGWTVFVLRDDPFGLYVHEGERYPDPRLLRALRLNVPKDSAAQPGD
jgi:endoglucanase